MCQIFSASVPENAGYTSPAPVAGLPGWTVDRMGQQNAFYRVTHNLGVSYPGVQQKIFVYSEYQAPLVPANPNAPVQIYNKKVEIFSQDANSFVVHTQEKSNLRPEFYDESCPFGFVLVLMAD